MFQKIRSLIQLIQGGHWASIFSKYAWIAQLITSLNYFPIRKKYRYILIGGHGSGLLSMTYYLEMMQAKPQWIYAHEMMQPFLFFRDFDGMILDKAIKGQTINKILATLQIKVPCYQLLRDPISMIKSCVNASLFHRIDAIHTNEQMQDLLIEILEKTAHLIFYFTSSRKPIEHLIASMTYWTQECINQDQLHQTLLDFAKTLGYHLPVFPQESVLKGSLFPRAFPYLFELDGISFGLFPNGRENKSSELNQAIFLARKARVIPLGYVELKTFYVQGFEDFPLRLVTWNLKDKNAYLLQKANVHAMEYIQKVLSALKKHQRLCLHEEGVIAILRDRADIGEKIAKKIHQELAILRKEAPMILETFAYTKTLLEIFNQDMMEG